MEEEKNKEGFYQNSCCCVNVKTKKIVSMEVTKENVHDGKILKELVSQCVSNNNNIRKVLADGTCDSKDNFRCLKELKITPVIKGERISPLKITSIVYRENYL